MKTWQDFEAVRDSPEKKTAFVESFIQEHIASGPYRTAQEADLYDRQKNTGVDRFLSAMQEIDRRLNYIDHLGPKPETVKSNAFRRLNVQRTAYSLANGVTFPGTDGFKEALGEDFDEKLYEAGYLACIHGEAFGFWNAGRLEVFSLLTFAPLYDEENGTLRAGVHFWRLQPDKPIHAVLYEEEGTTRYIGGDREQGGRFRPVDTLPRPYKTNTITTPDGGPELVEGEGYGTLPVVPLWGSSIRQSTLDNLKGSIDNIDLILNGFCDDVRECAQVFWLVSNYGGMKDEDLREFLKKLRYNHIANVNSAGESVGMNSLVSPYTQEVPTTAREALLTRLHSSMYEDFGALDVHCVSAGSTNDHLEAAYQPLDENARDFEKQVTKFIRQILRIAGLPDANPQYTHVRVSNTREQVEMVLSEAAVIGDEAAIDLLPNIPPEMKEKIKANRALEAGTRETIVADEEQAE